MENGTFHYTRHVHAYYTKRYNKCINALTERMVRLFMTNIPSTLKPIGSPDTRFWKISS